MTRKPSCSGSRWYMPGGSPGGSTWDYLHCPPDTEHITIGAGDEPCAILMVGTRTSDDPGLYPAEPLAARYGASVGESTADPKQAYAGRPPSAPARSPWPLTGPA